MKKWLCLATAMLMVLPMVACGAQVPAAAEESSTQEAVAVEEPTVAVEPAAAEATASDETYAFLTCLSTLEYWNPHKKAMEDACNALGVKWEFVGDENYEQDTMVTLFETIMNSGKYAGIVTSGQVIDGYKPIITKGLENGIPTAIVTLDIPGGAQIVTIATDYVNYGKVMGRMAAEACSGTGKVILSTYEESGIASVFDMREGIETVFAEEYPGMQIVAVVEDKADATTGAQAVGAALQANPDASVVIGLQSDPSAIGATTAIREAGLEGKVKVIAMDLSQTVLEMIKDGSVYASVAGKQYAEVYYAMLFLYQYNHNTVALTSDDRAAEISSQPCYVDPGSIVVTAANVDYFLQ